MDTWSKQEPSSAELKRQGYLTCGQFAALCQVKKQTLFHYDDIDLLKPVFVNDKGYRFYSYDQYSTFALIASLKDAGLSLAEIRSFLDGTATESRIDMLRSARDAIQTRIDALRLVHEALGIEIQRAEEAKGIDAEQIQLLHFPQLDLLRSRDLSELDDADLVAEVRTFTGTVEVVCAALDVEAVRQGNFDAYRYVLAHEPDEAEQAVIQDLDPERFVPYRRDAGRYCVAYHRGGNDTIGQTYGRLLAHCDELGYSLGDLVFEEYLQGELTADDETEHLTRICIQVK